MNSQLTGKDPDVGKDGRQKEKRVTEDEINSMDMNLAKLQEMVREEGGLVCHSPLGHKELDTTWQLNTNTYSPGAVGATEVN